jgi:hypothetical protein
MDSVVYNPERRGGVKIFHLGLSTCPPSFVFQVKIRTPPGKTIHLVDSIILASP